MYEYDHLLDACLHGIANATNLRSCTWTRDGSMNSDVLRVLQRCSQLEDLEINGHHDPEILKRFTALRKIRLIMPSPAIVDMLPAWLDALRYDLKNLTIVCKVGVSFFLRLVTDLTSNYSRQLSSQTRCSTHWHHGSRDSISFTLWVARSSLMKEFSLQSRRTKTASQL